MADLISVFLFQFFFCCTFSESRVTPVIMVWLHTSIHKRTTCGDKFVGGARKEICPTETESARLLLPYQIDLISVQKGLENITCI